MPEEMPERSWQALELADEAEQKFDYFTTGLLAAVLGYLMPTLTPAPLGVSPQTAELVSMLLLVAALFASFKRVELTVGLRRLSAKRLQAAEIGWKVLAARQGSSQILDLKNKTVDSPEKLARSEAALENLYDEQEVEWAKLEKVRDRWYSVRYLTMVGGFAALLAANLWKGYC